MVSQFIPCHDCGRSYDPQNARCTGCGAPTAINQMWFSQGGQPPSIAPRAWLWGATGAIILWALICLGIGYVTG